MKNNEPFTKLVGKEFSPLVVRRYSQPILTFVGIITDDNLSDLDSVVNKFFVEKGVKNDIQEIRNLAGGLTERLKEHYKKVEGIGVLISFDKGFCSSLVGDMMCHQMCRDEFYYLVNIATKV